MESRNTRAYREFVRALLRVDGVGDVDASFAGVLCLDAHGGVEFADGAFLPEPSARHLVRVALGALDGSDPLVDARQFPRLCEQPPARDRQLRALRVGGVAFRVVSAGFASACAVSSGRALALVVEQLPFGTLVLLARRPQTLERVLPLVSAACAQARRS